MAPVKNMQNAARALKMLRRAGMEPTDTGEDMSDDWLWWFLYGGEVEVDRVTGTVEITSHVSSWPPLAERAVIRRFIKIFGKEDGEDDD